MDKMRMPFIPEDVLKIQRVEIYLNDLKDRLKELRIHHDEVIHSSVKLIQEIDEVSSTLGVTSSNSMTKIKKLILEFESAKDTLNKQRTPVVLGNHIDVQKILRNFEKLNESNYLKDSLAFLSKTRDSLQQIDTYLENGLSDLRLNNLNKSVKDKIDMLQPNQQTAFKVKPRDPELKLEDLKDPSSYGRSRDQTETISNYASCCSSLTSLSLCKNSLNGYEGDNDDSEIDLISQKKKL